MDCIVVDDGSSDPINIIAMVGASIVSPIFTPSNPNSSGCTHDGSYEEKHLTNPFRSLILYQMSPIVAYHIMVLPIRSSRSFAKERDVLQSARYRSAQRAKFRPHLSRPTQHSSINSLLLSLSTSNLTLFKPSSEAQ